MHTIRSNGRGERAKAISAVGPENFHFEVVTLIDACGSGLFNSISGLFERLSRSQHRLASVLVSSENSVIGEECNVLWRRAFDRNASQNRHQSDQILNMPRHRSDLPDHLDPAGRRRNMARSLQTA